ncbi:cytochrome c oxidase assembly factor CtaG [Paenibacillus tarimensis]|uniref:cytochrome c oxidase assembly factor CtaG n=1 Tax=Paenibacillus tarimensis TaxID=416012 RepID=UPI001F1F4293|nr:cytochrome c oxidase assembly factor CtaG [Paenibacillus tarimensis]MCF2943440.1 cytochrome c oxidase assembly factor CtaG [Paenibacillus tarimensis]
MLDLQYFSFEELWSPFFFFFMAGLVILYFYMIGPWRENHVPDEPKATISQRCYFVVAAILYYLAQGGPLELLGHLNFTFHMVNMSLSYLIVPPLALLGIPGFLWRKAFSANIWKRLSWLMHPLLTLLLFNMLFSLYHVPVVHDFVMTHFTVHRIYYMVLLVTSFMMWWQIVCPVPEWSRLSDVKKMGYIFANGVLLTPACALIIFSGEPLYAIYNDPAVWVTAMGYCLTGDPALLLQQISGPDHFTMTNALEDQQAGGIIMKLVQEVMYGAILAYVFYSWFRREHSSEDDPMPSQTEHAGGNA